MEKTRIAVIGLGGVAQLVHLPILTKLDTVTIAGVAEVNKTRLHAIADKYAVGKRFTDYKQMLKEIDLDAVIITTPTNTHHDIAIDCLEAEKHVLVEKPMARNVAETKNINDTAARKDRLAMAGMNLRFRPDAMLLKSLINSGELGEIFYIKCGWLRKQSSNENWLIKKSESGGGVIIDLGIVLLDLALWLLEFPSFRTVSVQTYHHQIKSVEDSAVGLIRCANSAVINFEVSWSIDSEKDTFGLAAFGTKGTARLNPLRAYRKMGSTQIDYTPSTASNVKNLFKKSYENELKHFIGAIRTNNPVISSSQDAIMRMELLELIYKSAEQASEIIL